MCLKCGGYEASHPRANRKYVGEYNSGNIIAGNDVETRQGKRIQKRLNGDRAKP